jgi:hypothetical protein
MITINLDKAKNVAHQMRRAARAEEFKPHDEVIMKQIPGVDVAVVEEARAEIRAKYSAMQADIDSASTPEEIKQALGI